MCTLCVVEERSLFRISSSICKHENDHTPIFQDSGAIVDDDCKPKLAKILSDGNVLVNNHELDPADKAEVSDKMVSLKDRTQRVDTAVRVTRMKYVLL